MRRRERSRFGATTKAAPLEHEPSVTGNDPKAGFRVDEHREHPLADPRVRRFFVFYFALAISVWWAWALFGVPGAAVLASMPALLAASLCAAAWLSERVARRVEAAAYVVFGGGVVADFAASVSGGVG